MFYCEESCPGNCLFAQIVISDFEGGDELKESSEVKGLLGPNRIQVGTGVEQLTGPQHRTNVVESIVRPAKGSKGTWSPMGDWSIVP